VTTSDGVLDLDAARAERAKGRAAAREGAGETLRVRFGGRQIAELPAEFPLAVLEPLRDVNVDIAYVIRAATQVTNDQERQAGLQLLVDVLAANPALPVEIIGAVKDIGRRLLGDDGYAALAGQQPTWWDVRDLVKGVLGWYGMGLGESSPSTPSSGSDGETSKPTSSATTKSTPAARGGNRARRASSVPAG
jgi:hypothetical protein